MHRVDYLSDPTAPKANSIVVATSVYVENDEGRVLLILRTDNGLWAMPGGGMDIGETVLECAFRETREETGVEVVITSLVGIFTNPAHVVAYPDGEVRQQFSICLRARPIGGTPHTSDESRDVRWVPCDELDQLNVDPDTRRRIEYAMRNDQAPHVD
jgi:8-oxo-dGTP pyrophosphatase MutT (NUDIX family)